MGSLQCQCLGSGITSGVLSSSGRSPIICAIRSACLRATSRKIEESENNVKFLNG